ncbi:MAG: ROK family protein [Acidimicrobiaceae bacterium]|nr:ROK family protein [Acidimicrobiaceae bacterium]
MASDIALGVDVGGTKSLAVLMTRNGDVLDELTTPTPHDPSRAAGEAMAEVLAGQARELTARHGVDAAEVPIGIGVPGLVRRDGSLAYAPNLQSASGADLPSALFALLNNHSVHVENDGNCAALAEYAWGAGQGVDDFVMVTLGTGIGGGLIANGDLVRGRSGFAGEIGHMVVEARGAPCHCGGYGCWERYASGSGLGRLASLAAAQGRLPTLSVRAGGPELVRAEHVTAAAAEGLSEALALLDEVAWWLSLGISNLVAIMDAGHFVIGGGLSVAADFMVPSATTYLAELVEGYPSRPPITLVPSAFGVRAGAIGAAAVAFERAG